MKLFDATSHEPLTDTPWDEERARRAIREIVADAEVAFSLDSLWPNHPLDDFEEKSSPPQRSLYFGAAGMLWALHELARTNAVELEADYSRVAAQLHDGYLIEPDDFGEEPAPSYLLGESGILLAAERWEPDAQRRDLILTKVRENEDSEVRELIWGSPGTMLVAQALPRGKRRGAVGRGVACKRGPAVGRVASTRGVRNRSLDAAPVRQGPPHGRAHARLRRQRLCALARPRTVVG